MQTSRRFFQLLPVFQSLPAGPTFTLFLACVLGLPLLAPVSAVAQSVTYETQSDGQRVEVRTQVLQEQVPVTEMREQQQTVYRPQVTSDNLQQQQLVTVPITQYQLVSRIHGRWNPFMTPYWTHHYEPVTTWQQQVATVQVPVNRVAWQPEVRTVQVPVTTYRTAQKTITTRVAVNDIEPSRGASALASTSLTPSASATLSAGPSATLAARPATIASTPIGGQKLDSDPPRQPTGWQSQPAPNGYERYRR